MDKSNNARRTYTDSGFNGFLRRSLGSNTVNNTLADMSRNTAAPASLNFDNMQVSGSLGDRIEVGNILIDGSTGDGRIDGRDPNRNTTWRIGDIEGV